MKPDVNLNALWCRCIAEELRRAGIIHAVLCPGSRNAPLLFALAHEVGDGCSSHIDERSAAYLALGLARATGKPAAICVTSGSALANCLPAIAEASAAGVPLIVVAADRPWELHDCGAPQSMPQRGIFRDFLADELDLGDPAASDAIIRALRSRVSRIAQIVHGPTLINVPLREPLAPIADPDWRPPKLSEEAHSGRAGSPFTATDPSMRAAPPTYEWLRPGLRGLIVAGADAGKHEQAVRDLAQRSGFPLIADAASSLRQADMPNLVCTADALLTGSLGQIEPELIVQIGQAPIARAVYEFVGRQRCPLLRLEDAGNHDFTARAWAAIPHPDASAFAAIAERCRSGDRAWRELWLAAETQARSRIAQVADGPWSETVAAHLAINHPAFTTVHLAASMPVRHANLQLLPRACRVHANRGLNGIDGVLGTFIGLAKGSQSPALTLCGDLAFLHDLPALAAAKQVSRCAIVILNNDGGGIFDFLPVSQVSGYGRWVRTPHGMSFSAAAQQFGLPYERVDSARTLTQALDRAASGKIPHVVECSVADGKAVDQHRALIRGLVS